MPHRARPQYPDVADLIPEYRELVAQSGRDLASVPVSIWGAKQDLAMLERDRSLGVVRIIVSLDSAKADAILPELDRWAEIIRKLG